MEAGGISLSLSLIASLDSIHVVTYIVTFLQFPSVSLQLYNFADDLVLSLTKPFHGTFKM